MQVRRELSKLACTDLQGIQARDHGPQIVNLVLNFIAKDLKQPSDQSDPTLCRWHRRHAGKFFYARCTTLSPSSDATSWAIDDDPAGAVVALVEVKTAVSGNTILVVHKIRWSPKIAWD